MLFQGLRAVQRKSLPFWEAGICRNAFDRIRACARPRAKRGVVFGTKAFDSLHMIVLYCNFFKLKKK